MKKEVAFVFSALLFSSYSVKANDALVGSTFVCPGKYGAVYTFFPGNKYDKVIPAVSSRTTPISYDYDGKKLTIKYIGVNGQNRTLSYKVEYLEKKGKLIMTDDQGNTQICDER